MTASGCVQPSSLRPRQVELISIDVAPVFLGESVGPWFGLYGESTARYRGAEKSSDEWLARCTDIEASDPIVQSAWNRAASDLWSLQSLRGDHEEMFTPMAGIPKYTALFGRDALTAGIHSALLNRLDAERRPAFRRRVDRESCRRSF